MAEARSQKESHSYLLLQMSYFTMKITLFLDIIGRDEIFSEHGFQPALASGS